MSRAARAVQVFAFAVVAPVLLAAVGFAAGQLRSNRAVVFVAMGVLIAVGSARMRRAIRESEGKFRAVFDSDVVPLQIARADGLVTDANDAFLKLVGLTRDQLDRGEIWFTDLTPPEWRWLDVRLVEQLAKTGRFGPLEKEYRLHDGRRVPVLIGGSALPGHPDYGVAFILDQTEQKRAQAALEEQLVLTRKIEREREGLLESERAARGEAERASRMKDEFLATVSHELRTPLSAIMGWVHLLRRPGMTPEQTAKGLDVIERNARLQTQLVSDLLDVSRIVSGKIHLERVPVDLAQVVEAALDEPGSAARAKGVELRKAIAYEGDLVLGDAGRLAQIVTNLASNAIKFTPRGGRVAVELARAGGRLVLSVSDTGIGIATEFLPYVFDRFRQADASATRQFAGLGLGLSIVRRLAELHHGSVRAESAGVGQGARFVVELPVALAAAEVAGAHLGSAGAARHDGAHLSGAKVLVVDDEPDVREVLVRVLEESGASVVAAPSAPQALELIDAERPDVVVSDIGMPGMDGYELIRRIRSMRASVKDVPAIAVTAFARGEDRAHALGAGFQAHLAKPIEPMEMVEAIERLLPRSERSRAAVL